MIVRFDGMLTDGQLNRIDAAVLSLLCLLTSFGGDHATRMDCVDIDRMKSSGRR